MSGARPTASKAKSAPPPVSSWILATARPSLPFTVSVAPKSASQLELGVEHVHGDDARGARQAAALDHREAHPPAAEDRDAGAGRDLGGVDGRAHAGHHAAADERGLVEGQVVVDLHRRRGRHHRLLGHAAEELHHVQVRIAEVGAAGAVQHLAVGLPALQ